MSFGICSVCLHPSERKQEKEGALKGQRMLGGEGEKTRIEEGGRSGYKVSFVRGKISMKSSKNIFRFYLFSQFCKTLSLRF